MADFSRHSVTLTLRFPCGLTRHRPGGPTSCPEPSHGQARVRFALATAHARTLPPTRRGPLVAADAETVAITRAKALLASRGHLVARVVIVEQWPKDAPSPEAFAVKGTIFVNRRGNILHSPGGRSQDALRRCPRIAAPARALAPPRRNADSRRLRYRAGPSGCPVHYGEPSSGLGVGRSKRYTLEPFA